MSIQVSIDANGRMSLPADVRKRLGLDGGGTVLLEETDDCVVLRTVSQAVARAQALSRKWIAGKDGGSVDDFIAERRRAADAE